MNNRKAFLLYSIVSFLGLAALAAFLPEIGYRLARDGLSWAFYGAVLLWLGLFAAWTVWMYRQWHKPRR